MQSTLLHSGKTIILSSALETICDLNDHVVNVDFPCNIKYLSCLLPPLGTLWVCNALFVQRSIRDCWCQAWLLLGSLSGAICNTKNMHVQTQLKKDLQVYRHGLATDMYMSHTNFGSCCLQRSRSGLVPALFEDEPMVCDRVSIWPEPDTSNRQSTFLSQLSARNPPEAHLSPLMHHRPLVISLSDSLSLLYVPPSPLHSPLCTLLCACALMTTTWNISYYRLLFITHH